MKAMILAAGFGTRLRPLTDVTPKPLLPVAGTPMIVWNLLLLKRHGILDVVINLHHLGAMIEQALGGGARFGMRITYSHEPVILGTGGGIKQAESSFGGEPVLVLNGDTLFELNLTSLLAFHQERDAAATLVLRHDPEAARWGLVEVTDQAQVMRITGRGRFPVTTDDARGCLPVSIFCTRASCVPCRSARNLQSLMPMCRAFRRGNASWDTISTAIGPTSARRTVCAGGT